MDKLVLMLCIFFLTTHVGCQEKTVQKQITEEVAAKVDQDAKALVNAMVDGIYTDNNLTFVYPTGSQKRTVDTAIGPVFIIYFDGGDGINLACMTQEISEAGETVTLEEYTEAQANEYGNSVSDPKLLSQGEIEIGGHPAFERTYVGTRTDGSGVVFEFTNSWTVVNNKACVFTLSGPASELAKFRPAALKIIKSVQFKSAD